jgi:hypothetical protein
LSEEISGVREEGGKVLTNGRVGHNDHYVGVGREDVDESGEVLVLDFHGVELSGEFGAGQLELLYYVRHLLEALRTRRGLEGAGGERGAHVDVAVGFALRVGDDEKRRPFEEQHFVGVNDFGEMSQMFLQFVNIRNERVDDR